MTFDMINDVIFCLVVMLWYMTSIRKEKLKMLGTKAHLTIQPPCRVNSTEANNIENNTKKRQKNNNLLIHQIGCIHA